MRFVRQIVIAICVVLALGTLVLYPLSYRNRLFVGWQRMEQGSAPDCRSVEVFATRGSVGVEAYARDTFWLSMYQLTAPEWWDRDGLYAGAGRADPVSVFAPPESFNVIGVHVHHEHRPVGYATPVVGHTVVAVPLWFALLLFAAYPAFVIVRRRRGKRDIGTSHCPDCGYDVRATPHRCPECGRNLSGASSTVISS